MTVETEVYDLDRAYYNHIEGITVYREYGKTPNGNPIGGRWVYRKDGVFMDFDQYQSDLMERNKLKERQ